MEDYGNAQYGILKGLDAQTVEAMKHSQRNWNDDFIQGYESQVFETNSTGENLAIISESVASSMQLIDTLITPKLVSYVSSYMTNVLSSYLTECITDMISFDAGAITSYASKMIPKYLIGGGEILGKLLKSRETMNDELLKDTQLKMIESINDSLSTHVEKITTSIHNELDKIGPQIKSIAKYSQMGPVWVQQKIDLAIKKTMETSLNAMGEIRDSVNLKKEAYIQNLGDKLGKQLAAKTNEKLKTKSKEQLDKIEEQKQKAISKAKTMIINVKMKLFALIGA